VVQVHVAVLATGAFPTSTSLVGDPPLMLCISGYLPHVRSFLKRPLNKGKTWNKVAVLGSHT